MLLLLFLVHVIYTNGRPVSGPQLDSRALTQSCDDINECRKLSDIIWGCLATIFACTWVSVHPNVPPPNQSRLALFWRRLKLMLIAIIAPELMVGFAARQFFTARSFAKDFGISKTHGFFICMGGFVSRSRHNPIVTEEQLDEALGFITDIRAVEEEDIEDKSKGDALSKGVALVQGLWFTTQCIARVHQRLPVSELEVTTLAFAVINIFIYVLWWAKPLDVQRPILVGPQGEAPTVDLVPDEPNSSLLGPSAEKHSEEVAKPWRGDFLDGLVGALYGNYGEDYNPTSYASVPSFWSTASNDLRDSFNRAFYTECLVGAIFGGIHCAAWNADFPSTTEMWMWRSSALALAAIPGIVAGYWMVGDSDLVDDNFAVNTILAYISLLVKILAYISLLALVMYPIARLFLIVLPLIALRAPPPGALTDVNWSIYIPHL
ncbi:hypothetical protein C8R43DRAFT_485640 [Mycena crocata]|nr:hypothetical protein C8R43DRAFT_485640 [Mycena crocata]